MSDNPIAMQMAALPASGGLTGAEHAKSGHLPPAYGIDPPLDVNGDHIIPPPTYNSAHASGGFLGMGGVGLVGGSIDQTLQSTASIIDGPILGAIRKGAALCQNPFEQVGDGTLLSPANIKAFNLGGISNELTKGGLQHVGIGEQIHAMSGLGVVGAEQQGQGH